MAKKPSPEEAAPMTVTVCGQEHEVMGLGMPEVAELQIFAKSLQPNPLKEIALSLNDFDEHSKRRIIDNALERMRSIVEVGSEEFMFAMRTKEGMRHLLYFGLRRGGAQVSREDTDPIADSLTALQGATLLRAVFNNKALIQVD